MKSHRHSLFVACRRRMSKNISSGPRVIKTKNAPIHWFATDESHSVGGSLARRKDEGALRQVTALANSDIPVGPVAVMPDVHIGKGSVVGAVFASAEKVCPMAVGVDIGCGMTAVKIDGLRKGDSALRDKRTLRQLQNEWKRRIPVGFNSHQSMTAEMKRTVARISEKHPPSDWLHSELKHSSIYARQIGTLGGGNHFLELLYEDCSGNLLDTGLDQVFEEQTSAQLPEISSKQSSIFHGSNALSESLPNLRRDKSSSKLRKRQKLKPGALKRRQEMVEAINEQSDVWLMLHSGSRRIGNLTATYWDKAAAKLHGSVPNSGYPNGADALHWLYIDSAEGRGYLRDMVWCQEYARCNRAAMMEAMAAAVEYVFGKAPVSESLVCTHHNFCQCEYCEWKDTSSGRMQKGQLWVTRKGATSARRGELGIIPGSMATGSYVVEGLGLASAWNSCSHGAGRTMSRTEARRTVANEQFFGALKTANVVCDMDARLKDEAPQAYKDLSKVVQAQVDAELIRVKHRLLPLLNVKGF